jgi:guanylate kinase
VPQYKIALIGHSGAGKSACLRELGGNPAIAEMDRVLGTGKWPSMQEALEWIVSTPPDQSIVVFGVHIDTLREIAQAKERQDSNSLLFQVRFVFLCNHDRRSYENRLRSDPNHSESNIHSALNSYEPLMDLFIRVADYIIVTTHKSIAQVADEVLAYQATLV